MQTVNMPGGEIVPSASAADRLRELVGGVEDCVSACLRSGQYH